MRPVKNALVAAWLGLALAACADSTGPLPTAGSVAQPMSAWSGLAYASKTTTTSATAPTDSMATTLTPLSFLAGAPRLTTYDTTFVLTQGWSSKQTIYFAPDARGMQWPFMVLEVPVDAQFVDSAGVPVPTGSTVRLTVHVDRQSVQFNFGPHGSSFPYKPATLTVYTQYTNMTSSSGTIWYQPDANTAWSPIPTVIDSKKNRVIISLAHFSNYAVAYRK